MKGNKKPFNKPYFSARPNTSSAPWPRPISDDSRTNTPGQIPTGQIPTGHIPTGQLPPLQNTPWTYTHHKMKCEEKP